MISFITFLNEDTEITTLQLKKFEMVVNALFKKYGIDFEFSKHFENRINHDRNNPKISLKELSELMKKIYAKHGNPLKNEVDTETVINDIQSKINIPIAIKYDSKNDEIDVVLKTIMRKQDFKTPDTIIKY